MKKLALVETLAEGCTLAVANVIPLILTVILYILTCWVPYLNVGTTIGLMRLIIDMTKGKVIDPLSIFQKENFSGLGDFFLLIGLMSIGLAVAACFMFVPAIIMGIAWNYALYLMIEKKISPFKAISLSEKVTNGEKWNIFFIYLVATIAVILVIAVFASIPKVGGIFALLLSILACALFVAIEAVMYRHFSEKADLLLEGECVQAHVQAAE